jgi:oxygen-independent coproporphyrinogen-3 oxidase
MIYIHVPFCHRKCTYCAFYSKPLAGAGGPLGGYVDGLVDEMRQRRGEQAHPIRTVYFGGGTPSILPLVGLERITASLRNCFDLSAVEEMTIEANPEDLSPDYLAGLRALGFNRLSIGVQSLDDKVLKMLNRRHTAAQAVAALEDARRAGFGNISVDFIYGLPMELRFEAFDFQMVTHVSAYALTVEPGTVLAAQVEQGRVALPDEDEVVRQYYALRGCLATAGFEQYEVSNYARPGYRSRHNSRYWDRTPYLGLGPGAHSFDGQRRRWNGAMQGDSGVWTVESEETLTEADAYNELLMTALRTADGLSEAMVPAGYKERLHRMMQPYVDCGWIEACRTAAGGVTVFRPTAEGLLHADGMAAALFA